MNTSTEKQLEIALLAIEALQQKRAEDEKKIYNMSEMLKSNERLLGRVQSALPNDTKWDSLAQACSTARGKINELLELNENIETREVVFPINKTEQNVYFVAEETTNISKEEFLKLVSKKIQAKDSDVFDNIIGSLRISFNPEFGIY
jgi:hypothetical protein